MKNNKDFWSRPEGTFTKILGACLGISIAFIFVKYLTVILAFVANTVALVSLLAILVIAYFVISSKTFQSTIGLSFKALMRLITSYIVKMDPIAILEQHLNVLKERLNKMTIQMNNVKGIVNRLVSKLEKYKNDIEESTNIAKKAQAELKKNPSNRKADKNFKLHLRNVKRRKVTFNKLVNLHLKISKMYHLLLVMYDKAEFVTDDTAMAIEALKDEHNAVTAGASAIKQLKSILNGNANDNALYNEAWEITEDQIFTAIGEIDGFMDRSASLINSYDEKTDDFNDKALLEFDDWEAKASKYLTVDIEALAKLEMTEPIKKFQELTINF